MPRAPGLVKHGPGRFSTCPRVGQEEAAAGAVGERFAEELIGVELWGRGPARAKAWWALAALCAQLCPRLHGQAEGASEEQVEQVRRRLAGPGCREFGCILGPPLRLSGEVTRLSTSVLCPCPLTPLLITLLIAYVAPYNRLSWQSLETQQAVSPLRECILFSEEWSHPFRGQGSVPGSICSRLSKLSHVGGQQDPARAPCVDSSDQGGNGGNDQRALERPDKAVLLGRKHRRDRGWG